MPEHRFSLSNHPNAWTATFALLFSGMSEVIQEVGPESSVPTRTALSIKKKTILFKKKKKALAVGPRGRITPSFLPPPQVQAGINTCLRMSFFKIWDRVLPWMSAPSSPCGRPDPTCHQSDSFSGQLWHQGRCWNLREKWQKHRRVWPSVQNSSD